MDPDSAYKWLLDHNKETAYIESAQSLLGWDQRTYIPAHGHAHRAAQLAVMAKLLHGRMTDPKMGEMLSAVEGTALVSDPLSPEAVNVREWRRDHDRAVKIPEDLAVELARAGAEGESAWEAAKPANDWEAFKPYLERIVRLKCEEADALGYAEERYDALLDEFEPGETVRDLEPLFSRLREPLVDLMDYIRGSGNVPDISVLHRRFPRFVQGDFSREVASRIGYNFAAGRLDSSAHPFSTGIGPGDVRITTRYDEEYFSMAVFGTIHEAGHAIYEQGLPADAWGAPMGRSVSLGIHESQSRLWENFVGRSRGFWRFFHPEALRRFDVLSEVSLDAFLFAVNDVRPGFIRTEADEVTYNLHVMLRFELELALLRGRIEVKDLPEAWNEKMREYLELTPPDYARGVLQDIHWSGGAIGYFPTYTLGNVYAAQFFARAERDLGGLEETFAAGEFKPLLEWLREKIHSQGSRYRPRDLVRFVTGEDPNPEYLVGYLNKKYRNLYGSPRS